jgi:hypothetical protein
VRGSSAHAEAWGIKLVDVVPGFAITVNWMERGVSPAIFRWQQSPRSLPTVPTASPGASLPQFKRPGFNRPEFTHPEFKNLPGVLRADGSPGWSSATAGVAAFARFC